MWTPTTITSHISEQAQKVRLLLCSCDVLFMLSPNFVISHKKEYVSIFCTWSLFLSFSLCFYQKDLPLPRKNSRWVLPLFNPSFLLSILSLYHPSTPWGKHNLLHGQKNNHTKLWYIVFIKASLPERTWGWEALWDHKHAFHILSESYEDASVVLRVWSVDFLCERGGWGLLK